MSVTAGAYEFWGPQVNDSPALAGYRTTQAVSSMTIDFNRTIGQSATVGTGGPGLATGTSVPEPGTFAMIGIATVAGVLIRRRRG